MHVVHGTWIPESSDAFVRSGTFCLWVETDTPNGPTPGPSTPPDHPGQLAGDALETFLTDRLGQRSPPRGALADSVSARFFLLPSAAGAPLPSFELLPYVASERAARTPERFELAWWRVCCYEIASAGLITTLNTMHFLALHAAQELQLGADLLFWCQYTQALKGTVLARDGYIPALKYRALAPTRAKARQGGSRFELYPAWDILSDAYESAIQRYTESMPAACAAGSDVPAGSALFNRAALLRHFSEWLVHDVVTGTPLLLKLDQQIRDSLLYECMYPAQPTPAAGTPDGLALYRQWAAWRDTLSATPTGARFTLCFQLQEAPPTAVDDWQVHFLVAAKDDPSFRLSLADYWALGKAARTDVLRRFGPEFEKAVLLALGHAARIYPRVWEGLRTSHPVGFRLSLDEAFAFLQESAWVLEDAGYTVIVPAWWTPEGRRRARIRLKTSTRRSGGTAARAAGYFSLDTVVDYQYQLAIGGQEVSAAEWRQLIAAKTPLVQFRGAWMQLDRDRMQQMIEFWQSRQQGEAELTVLDLMKAAGDGDDDIEWDYDAALRDMLSRLHDKSAFAPVADPPALRGSLREYQRRGVAWLSYLESLGLNPCLADDMGLGKTVQVIARLLVERAERGDGEPLPSLLIAPTSVLGNWRKEIERFAPGLRTLVHQGSARSRDKAAFRAACREHDVVITSFALARLDEETLRAVQWHRVVVDEAQNIKNPLSAQTRAIAKLPARHRLALTGTPVENRLLDLWSIFNFLHPGYLGKQAQFLRTFETPIQKDHDVARSAALKKLVEPFILRRVKTDKQIIDDLPDKVEQKLYCNLTPEQASLYEAVVKDVTAGLEDAEGIQRRGMILATLLKLKQICNHPAQFLQDGSEFSAERSHKLQRLAEMLAEAVDNSDSVLVFTQFTEIGAALDRFVSRTLHYPTYYLHGGTSLARRDEMVAAFQDPDGVPSVFILSLRAGGVGLNLTAANQVFHFDRWWNPAVEDQATDRAFRIGQRKNVFVHKFVAIGTLEERLDTMIEDKKRLSSTIVGGSDESWLTELDNETFKSLIALQRSAVLE